MQTQHQIKEHARAFAVWREAMAVDWDCTVSELANACAMDPSTVRKIVFKRGWNLNSGYAGRAGVRALDEVIQ